ncbi:MAG: hypothetical protein NT105_12910 [Verrucomicrobia bacterium]|nr:hypothetical protein [Verrucomicrobiota bacterium]
MKRIAEILSWIALAVTLAPACLFFVDKLDLAQAQAWMLVATVLWFIATPFWMEHKAS